MSLCAVFVEIGIRVHIYNDKYFLTPPHPHTILVTFIRLGRLHQLLNIDMLNYLLIHQNVYFLNSVWLNVHYRKWYVNILHLLLTTFTKLQINIKLNLEKIKSWKSVGHAYFYTILKWLQFFPSDKVNRRLQISENYLKQTFQVVMGFFFSSLFVSKWYFNAEFLIPAQ